MTTIQAIDSAVAAYRAAEKAKDVASSAVRAAPYGDPEWKVLNRAYKEADRAVYDAAVAVVKVLTDDLFKNAIVDGAAKAADDAEPVGRLLDVTDLTIRALRVLGFSDRVFEEKTKSRVGRLAEKLTNEGRLRRIRMHDAPRRFGPYGAAGKTWCYGTPEHFERVNAAHEAALDHTAYLVRLRAFVAQVAHSAGVEAEVQGEKVTVSAEQFLTWVRGDAAQAQADLASLRQGE